jgi:hypothetical protein
MWLEAGLSRLVTEFWSAQPGEPEPFPRDLICPAIFALPVSVHLIPRLTTAGVGRYLRSLGVYFGVDMPGPDRRLCGCLLAHGGHGLILVESTDPPDERRFTLAHELGHFMLDYLEPRRRAIEALGEQIVPVLDGLRPPTHVERMHAVLSEVPLGLHVDLMERTGAGGYASRAIFTAEERADRLALELLAPAADVWAAISNLPEADGQSYQALHRRAADLLVERYGLPEAQAQSYAKWLLRQAGYRPGVREWLGIEMRRE